MKKEISICLIAMMLLQTIILPVEAQTEGKCTGTIDCSLFPEGDLSGQCSAAAGCEWISAEGACSGDALGNITCESYIDSGLCVEDTGCTWTETEGYCTGTSELSCSDLDETGCIGASPFGCTWEEAVPVNNVYAKLYDLYDGGENICFGLNLRTEGSPTMGQLELWIDGTYYWWGDVGEDEPIPEGDFPDICQFGPSCDDDADHEVMIRMVQSDGTVDELSDIVYCEKGEYEVPEPRPPEEEKEIEFVYSVDVTHCTTESVTYTIKNTGTSNIKASICGDVYFNDNNMGGIECRDIYLEAGSSQEMKSQVWADLFVGKTFNYKFNIWGEREQMDTCTIQVEKQILRGTSEAGKQIANLLNEAIGYAEKLDAGEITLAEFIMNVERERMEEGRRIWEGLSESERASVGQELVTIPSGEERGEVRLYSGSLVRMYLAAEKRAKWDVKGNLIYKWELNFWTDTYGFEWQERDEAWQEAEELWQQRKQEKVKDIAAQEAENLRDKLPPYLLEKADIMGDLIDDVVDAIKQYEIDGKLTPLAEARAKASIDTEKIMRDLFEAGEDPLLLLDLAHLVVLESPGTTEMWEEWGELKINYWKPVYPEDREEWDMADLRASVATPTEMDNRELKWNPPHIGLNIERPGERTWGGSDFDQAMWEAEDEYRRELEVGIAESKAKMLIDEIKAGMPAEILEGLTALRIKIKDYRETLQNYASGEATVYDVEYTRLKLEDDINEYIAENMDWDYALDVAMVLMADSAGEPLQMWGENELPDCRRVYSNVEYEMWEEEDMEEEWPIESEICVMRMDKREIYKMKEMKEKLEKMKGEECIMSGFEEVPHFVGIHVNWMIPWDFICKGVNRAGEKFFKERDSKKAKRFLEEKLVPEAEEGISKKALELKPGIISKLTTLKELTIDYNKGKATAFDLQYNVIKTREELGDLVYEHKLDAEDQMYLFILIVNDLAEEGYPHIERPPCGEEYDGVGISLASGDKAELNMGGHRFYEPLFSEYLGETRMVARLDVHIDVFWKDWSPQLEEELKSAWEKIESERADIELEEVKERRAEIEAEIEDRIMDLVAQKEDNELSAGEFKKHVFEIYRELQEIDHWTAKIMMRLGEESFPEEYSRVDVHIVRDSGIEVRIQEREYTYGVRMGEMVSEFARESKEYAEKVIEDKERRGELEVRAGEMGGFIMGMEEPEEVGEVEEREEPSPRPTGWQVAVITSKVAPERPREEKERMIEETVRRIEEIEGHEVEVTVGVKVGPGDKEIEEMKKYVGKGMPMPVETARAPTEKMMEGMSIKVNVDVKIMPYQMMPLEKRPPPEEIKMVEGLIPVHPPTINVRLTKEDYKRSGDEVRERWTKMKETGAEIKQEMLYSLNEEFANNPLITEILMAWGDTTTSFKLTREDGSLMEASFKTKEGQLVDVNFELDPEAGTSDRNILIEIDYEAVTELMNWWRGKLKDATSPLAILVNIPAFGFRLLWMMITGKIKISPLTAVLKFGDFLKVFDGAAKYATTGTII